MRDGFPEDVKRTLAGRTGYVCSNPSCKQPTSGPSEADKAVTNVGVAAHITAASPGGPRYNESLTQLQRSGCDNGIWLCQKCGKTVDDDPLTYKVEVLQEWKTKAEEAARKAIEEGPRKQASRLDVRVLAHKAYFQGNPDQYFFIKIVNTTGDTDVEVTHVWYECDLESLEVLAAPLPRRLKPFETYETWIPVAVISAHKDNFKNFRVQISTGEIFFSEQNVHVRPYGFVAGTQG